MRDYSYSRLSLFEGCPAAFKMRYLEKLPEAPSEALAFGGLVHTIIANYTRHCMDNGLPTDITAMPDIVRICFYEKPSGLPSSRYNEVLEVAERFAGSHVFEIDTIEGYEKWIQAWLSGKKFLFRGILDLLKIEGTTATIRDYKSDFQLRPQSEVEGDMQLKVYPWLVSLEYSKITTFRCELDFVRHDVVRTFTFERDQIPKIEKQVMGMIAMVEDAIAKNKFPATPGQACNWCGYTAACPKAQDIPADVRPIQTPEDARAMAEELSVLERQVAIRKDLLKAFCNKNGNVEFNGLAWGHHLVESRAIEDIDAFVKILNSAKQDPRPYLTISGTKVKKLFRDDTMLARLEPIIVEKNYTRFDSKNRRGT